MSFRKKTNDMVVGRLVRLYIDIKRVIPFIMAICHFSGDKNII